MTLTYFKPLRRKIGVLTLGLACLFAAGWVRSRTTVDQIAIDHKSARMDTFCSTSGTIQFIRWQGRDLTAEQFVPTNSVWTSTPNLTPVQFQKSGVWFPHRQFHHLDYGPDQSRLESDGVWGPNRVATGNGIAVPYCSIVVPLTVISAWLLLSKPRTKTALPTTPASENA